MFFTNPWLMTTRQLFFFTYIVEFTVSSIQELKKPSSMGELFETFYVFFMGRKKKIKTQQFQILKESEALKEVNVSNAINHYHNSSAV